MEVLYIILGVIAGLLLLTLWIIAPYAPSKRKKEPFYGANIAHRGLFSKDQSIPENSLAAFKNAVDAGYGVELDVQLSKDGKVVVIHDGNLKRVCGADVKVEDLDYDELAKYRLCGTDEKIPLFSEVLEVIGGKTPIIVELKDVPKNRELCEKTYALMNAYDGVTCMESFNPFIVAWFRFHAPKVYRGQLATLPEDYRAGGRSRLTSFLLGNLFMNFAARPNFNAYRICKKPFFVKICEVLGCVKVGWTSHEAKNEQGLDTVIFEHYRPEIKYK